MSINLNDNTKVLAPKPNDDWEGPYTSIDEAIEAIPTAFIFPGRTVKIIIDGKAVEYWWADGVNLVLKTAEPEKPVVNYKPAGGANALKAISFDEFSVGTTVKMDKYNRPLNANYDYYVLLKDLIDCKTDAENVLRNYISRIPQLEYLILQPIWFSTVVGNTNVDTTKIYPALGSIYQNLDAGLNVGLGINQNQWQVNNQFYNSRYPNDQSAVKLFDKTVLSGGTMSDDGFIEFQRLIKQLGYKTGVDAWFIGMSEDPVGTGQVQNTQPWRGYMTPDVGKAATDSNYVLISDFNAFCNNFYTFMCYSKTHVR